GICFTEWIWALDRSPASRNAFRAWVRKKYDNNIKLVNQSWHSDLKNFDEIGLPDGLRYVTYDQALTDKNWHDGDCGIFVNIKAHAKRSDYYRFHNEITARRIEDFARIIKDVTHGQKLCGAFYGYNTWNNIPARFAIGVGHLSIEKLLESDYIDFIAGVINYYDRGAGGVDFQLQAPKSIQASGKITFLENDIRTCLVSNDSLKLKIETMPDTLAVMTRNAAYAITNDCLMWWMDLGGGWYRNGQIMKRVKELQPLFGKKGYSPKPRIAIVLDEQAPYYLESGSLALLSLVHYQALEFARIGAPYDIIRLSDLKNRRADDYKMYVFLGTFSIDPALRKYLYDVFEKNRAVVLWGYGSGIYDGEKCSPGNISLTTGIGIKTHVSRGGLKAVSTGGSELSSGLQDITFGGKLRQATTVLTTVFEGVEPEISPVTYIDDPNVLPLASFVSDGRVAAGMKKMGEWRSVYFGTDNIPARLMQNLARSAGVHLYTDRTEPVYVGNGYLAISSAVGGQHEIKLPRKGDVYEAITGKCLVRGVDNFQALIPPKGTALFQINYER
ncbi:MAG: beta-galactosidase, partial [Victivallales bacterium]